MEIFMNQLPKNCPLRKTDYARVCPGEMLGDSPALYTNECPHIDECTRLSAELIEMNVPTDSELQVLFED